MLRDPPESDFEPAPDLDSLVFFFVSADDESADEESPDEDESFEVEAPESDDVEPLEDSEEDSCSLRLLEADEPWSFL